MRYRFILEIDEKELRQTMVRFPNWVAIEKIEEDYPTKLGFNAKEG